MFLLGARSTGKALGSTNFGMLFVSADGIKTSLARCPGCRMLRTFYQALESLWGFGAFCWATIIHHAFLGLRLQPILLTQMWISHSQLAGTNIKQNNSVDTLSLGAMLQSFSMFHPNEVDIHIRSPLLTMLTTPLLVETLPAANFHTLQIEWQKQFLL